jgi:predicted SprT family Zn-dependent metalloprotease
MTEQETATATLARELMDAHGLTDWTFQLTNGRETIGWCREGTRTIAVSRHHIAHHTDEQIRDTILHEIAHALATSLDDSHGYVWQSIARRIGANPEPCAYEPIP